MRYFEKIPGERLFLSPINPDDFELYTKWMNDPAVTAGLGNYRKMNSLPNERKLLEEMAANGHNYAIVLREGGRLIGNISLMDEDHVNCRATLGVFLGEEADRCKGYGAEAIRLLLGYGFNTLHLHNIQLHVYADNPRAIACYEKVGFREFGRRRESDYLCGRYVDRVHMDILDREFAQ